jgi:hypothetical protein
VVQDDVVYSCTVSYTYAFIFGNKILACNQGYAIEGTCIPCLSDCIYGGARREGRGGARGTLGHYTKDLPDPLPLVQFGCKYLSLHASMRGGLRYAVVVFLFIAFLGWLSVPVRCKCTLSHIFFFLDLYMIHY